MGIFFRKSVKIAPGLRLNISKRGTSVSIGPRGAKLNIGKRGTYVTTSIPGTGIYSRTKISGGSKTQRNSAYAAPRTSDAERFAKADPAAQGCGLLAGCLVGGLFLWLITGKFYSFLIMLGIGALMAFLPTLLASNKNDQSDNDGLGNQNNTLDEVERDLQYSKPFAEKLNALLEEMDAAYTETKLIDIHSQILDLMNNKLKGRKILFSGMSFDDAMKRIEEEYQKKLAFVRENSQIIPLTNEETNEIESNIHSIEKATNNLDALDAYDKLKKILKKYETRKGIIYDDMNYNQLFESVYQLYVSKCKELNKK